MSKIKLCASADIVDSGHGFRFKVVYNGEDVSAFAVRIDGEVFAYLNRCSHLPVELDWNYGDFLDESGFNVVCATHGAFYEGVSGRCLGGPCDGKPLVRLALIEQDNFIYWLPCETVIAPSDGIKE